jgi:AcrR family transcriptional regulator
LSTDSPPSRPLRADARRNRERVLTAAREVFAEGGLGASIEDVARRAGVGVATVCRNFATKQALVDAVISEVLWPLEKAAADAAADPDPGRAFEQFVITLAEFQASNRALAEEMAADARLSNDRLKRELRTAITALVVRAQAVGAVRPDIGPADLAMLFLGIAHAAALGGDEDRELHRRFVHIALDGLRTPEPTALPGRALDFSDLDPPTSR